MRLRLLLLSLCAAFSGTLSAQTPTDADAPARRTTKPSRDHVMLQVTYDNWTNTPDSVNATGFGRGFNGYLCFDFPIKTSNFSFATGIGIGNSNIFFKDQQVLFTDSGQTAVRFVPEQEDYKRFKLSTTYAEAPFELRFFSNKENRNKGFKAAIGMRAGLLIAAHTKGNRTENGMKLTEKVQSKAFLEKWRFGATARLGYGNFSLFGAYNFNNVFIEGKGPTATPYSIGLCISGL